jgi:hypothetical protein
MYGTVVYDKIRYGMIRCCKKVVSINVGVIFNWKTVLLAMA